MTRSVGDAVCEVLAGSGGGDVRVTHKSQVSQRSGDRSGHESGHGSLQMQRTASKEDTCKPDRR
jgi:hypothetical protein